MKKILFAVPLLAFWMTGCFPVPHSTILDVRSAEEYSTGHLPDALLIPVDEIPGKISGMVPDKKTPLAVYCRSGRRSANAAEQLRRMGYENVTDCGGIRDAAKRLDLPIVQEKGEQ